MSVCSCVSFQCISFSLLYYNHLCFIQAMVVVMELASFIFLCFIFGSMLFVYVVSSSKLFIYFSFELFFFLFRRMNECQCIAYTCFHFTPVRISYFQIFCVERECETELIQMYLFQLSPTFRGICAFHFHSNLYSFMKLSTNIICSLKLMFQWNNRIWC